MKQDRFMDKLIKFITSIKTIIGIQIVASTLLIVFITKMNVLPMKFFIPIIAVVIALLIASILTFYTNIKKNGKDNNNKGQIITKIVSVVISIVLVIGTYFVGRMDSFFSTVSKSEKSSTYVVSVIVMKNSPAKKLVDLNGKNFGVCYKNDTETLTGAIAHFEELIKEKTGTTEEQEYTKVDDYVKLADNLYDEAVDAIIVGDEYLSMLEANHENFEAETRVVEKYEITKVSKNTTVRTNVTEEPFNIYITGIDTYGQVSTVSRTDVNLLITVNPKTKQILMTSIPRDTEVILHSKKAMDKLTHSGMYGHDETINTIQDFLDVKINYYARTNFSGIIDIVDQLGGITIDSPNAFTTLHGNYKIVEGENKMDGDKALCFVRERYALPNGDFDRGKNQQLLLKALLNKAMSPTVITNFSNVLGAIENTFETDMSSDEIKSLLNMQINDMASWEIFDAQVSGVGYKTAKTYSMWGTEIYVMEPNTKQLKGIKQLIDKVESGTKLTQKDMDGLE